MYVVSVIFAVGGATALAIQNIALGVETDKSRATDAATIVAVVFVPISVVLYYPDSSITLLALVELVAAGLTGRCSDLRSSTGVSNVSAPVERRL